MLFDLGSVAMDRNHPYSVLAALAKERNTLVINDPDAALRFGDKCEAHCALEAAELPVPYGVVVRHDEIDWRTLTDQERRGLGTPFVRSRARVGWEGRHRQRDGDLRRQAEP